MTISRRALLHSALASSALLALGTRCATPGRPLARPSPKRILLLGGTGFLGPALVHAAQARGHTLTLFNRGKTRPGLFPGLEQLHGDRDTGDLKALEGRAWDAVIDTSGYEPRVVKASAELLAPQVAHYVFISSVSVHGDDARPGTDERSPLQLIPESELDTVQNTPALAAKAYAPLKAMCELAAERAMPGRVTSVRSGLMVGPEDPSDRFTYWPARIARGGEVLAPGDGRDPVQFIDVRDVAEWVLHCVDQPLLGPFICTGPERPLTLAQLLAVCQEATASRATLTWVPTAYLKAQGVVPWDDLPVWTGGAEGAAYSQAKALAAGLRLRPVRQTVLDTLAWFQTLPEERRVKPRAGLSAEREAALLARWHHDHPVGKDATDVSR